tara:strand:- start:8126 stop:8575 length:450 start_codon:yes stop_codon:yes gene_type:complete
MKKTMLIIHCSATKEHEDFTRDDIDRMHKNRGWKAIGYHWVIELDGKIVNGRDLDHDGEVMDETGAHALGYNHKTYGVCYIGGLDRNGKPKDTRTQEQLVALQRFCSDMIKNHGITEIIGHNEVANKACPCFDVQDWLEITGLKDELSK